MHFHLEIIMPPTHDVEAAVRQVMRPFDEGYRDEDGGRNRHPFWDFWVIGGRWSGNKIKCTIGAGRLEAFNAELIRRKVTVSGITAGKQELQPASQIPMVDALWREFFPESPLKACPLFKHFNDQYAHSRGFPDIMALKDCPKELTAERVIVAASRDEGRRLEAVYMMQDDLWNGVTHVDAAWDRKVTSALEMFKDRIKTYAEGYIARVTPKDDWLVVTVDYHS